jgi:hypothetical protein
MPIAAAAAVAVAAATAAANALLREEDEDEDEVDGAVERDGCVVPAAAAAAAAVAVAASSPSDIGAVEEAPVELEKGGAAVEEEGRSDGEAEEEEAEGAVWEESLRCAEARVSTQLSQASPSLVSRLVSRVVRGLILVRALLLEPELQVGLEVQLALRRTRPLTDAEGGDGSELTGVPASALPLRPPDTHSRTVPSSEQEANCHGLVGFHATQVTSCRWPVKLFSSDPLCRCHTDMFPSTCKITNRITYVHEAAWEERARAQHNCHERNADYSECIHTCVYTPTHMRTHYHSHTLTHVRTHYQYTPVRTHKHTNTRSNTHTLVTTCHKGVTCTPKAVARGCGAVLVSFVALCHLLTPHVEHVDLVGAAQAQQDQIAIPTQGHRCDRTSDSSAPHVFTTNMGGKNMVLKRVNKYTHTHTQDIYRARPHYNTAISQPIKHHHSTHHNANTTSTNNTATPDQWTMHS